ncbi:hypothetical protein FNF27_05461 [Cafeteria roenbergensis]|uniref:SbsA Ig-like domain-containing protein n=1 Tax=Cafeteria roenbergensis TaxID=33653 RepID=A0A5A8E5Q5_CAFRO|nr:hypothetical protein FNF27_05461 [Cafeteria roenbergensis]
MLDSAPHARPSARMGTVLAFGSGSGAGRAAAMATETFRPGPDGDFSVVARVTIPSHIGELPIVEQENKHNYGAPFGLTLSSARSTAFFGSGAMDDRPDTWSADSPDLVAGGTADYPASYRVRDSSFISVRMDMVSGYSSGYFFASSEAETVQCASAALSDKTFDVSIVAGSHIGAGPTWLDAADETAAGNVVVEIWDASTSELHCRLHLSTTSERLGPFRVTLHSDPHDSYASVALLHWLRVGRQIGAPDAALHPYAPFGDSAVEFGLNRSTKALEHALLDTVGDIEIQEEGANVSGVAAEGAWQGSGSTGFSQVTDWLAELRASAIPTNASRPGATVSRSAAGTTVVGWDFGSDSPAAEVFAVASSGVGFAVDNTTFALRSRGPSPRALWSGVFRFSSEYSQESGRYPSLPDRADAPMRPGSGVEHATSPDVPAPHLAWRASTASAADSPLVLTGMTPTHGATDIALRLPSVSVFFQGGVRPALAAGAKDSIVSIRKYDGRDWGHVQEASLASSTAFGCGVVRISLPPEAVSEPLTRYQVRVPAGAFAPSPLSSLTTPALEFEFQTSPDRVPPTLVLRLPQPGSVDVPSKHAWLRTLWSEPVSLPAGAHLGAASWGRVSIVDTVRGVETAVVSASAINTSVATADQSAMQGLEPGHYTWVNMTLPPEALAEDRVAYHVRIGPGFVEDLAGNANRGELGSASWGLRTTDINPPRVVGAIPALRSNATVRAFELSQVTLLFSEAVVPAGGTLQVLERTANTSWALRQAVDLFDREAALATGAALTVQLAAGAIRSPATEYKLNFVGDVVADAAGLSWLGARDLDWSFHTAPDAEPPQVVGRWPDAGASSVSWPRGQVPRLNLQLSELVSVVNSSCQWMLEARDPAAAPGTAAYVVAANLSDPSQVLTAPSALRLSASGALSPVTSSSEATELEQHDAQMLSWTQGSKLEVLGAAEVLRNGSAASASKLTVSSVEIKSTISAGCLSDGAGNSLPELSWTFSRIDSEPPKLLGSTPSAGESNVHLGFGAFTFAFSEPIMRGDGTVQVRDATSGLSIAIVDLSKPGVAVAAGSTLKLQLPATMLQVYLQHFCATLPQGAVLDAVGNAFKGATQCWRAEPDTYPPTITSFEVTGDARGLVNPSSAATASLLWTVSEGVRINSSLALAVSILHHGNGSLAATLSAQALAAVTVSDGADQSGTVELASRVSVNLVGEPRQGPWAVSGARYRVRLEAGAVFDSAGNPNQQASAAAAGDEFAMADWTAPIVSGLTPEPSSSGVDVGLRRLQIDVSEAVFPGPVTVVSGPQGPTVKVWDATDTSSPVAELRVRAAADVSVHSSSVVLWLQGAAISKTYARYYVTMADGAFVDGSGNALPGIQAGDWAFTTAPDSTAPMLRASVPHHAATGASQSLAKVTLQFNEAIRLGASGTIAVAATPGQSLLSVDLGADSAEAIAESLTVDDATLTVSWPAARGPIPEQAKVAVTLSAGAVVDVAGNELPGLPDPRFVSDTAAAAASAQRALEFTIEDVSPPSLVTVTPAQGSASVDAEASFVSLTFSEAVTVADSAVLRIYALPPSVETVEQANAVDPEKSSEAELTDEAAFAVAPGRFRGAGTPSLVVTLGSASLARSKTWFAILLSGPQFVRDVAGNPVAASSLLPDSGASAWRLRTQADESAPVLVSSSPASGWTIASSALAQVSLRFSEDVVLSKQPAPLPGHPIRSCLPLELSWMRQATLPPE